MIVMAIKSAVSFPFPPKALQLMENLLTRRRVGQIPSPPQERDHCAEAPVRFTIQPCRLTSHLTSFVVPTSAAHHPPVTPSPVHINSCINLSGSATQRRTPIRHPSTLSRLCDVQFITDEPSISSPQPSFVRPRESEAAHMMKETHELPSPPKRRSLMQKSQSDKKDRDEDHIAQDVCAECSVYLGVRHTS